MNFTQEEKELIDEYAKIPISVAHRINIWFVELLPPGILVGLGMYRDQAIYYIAAILVLVFFNVLGM